jgi:isocitrate/isopropylmalate dehydrogenase
MMLDHLGEHDAAARITKAVLDIQNELATLAVAPSTDAIGDLVAERM